MPRGGARPGAGRKPRNPDQPKSIKAKAKPAAQGFSEKGVKAEDAPAGWPFGTQVDPPAEQPAPDESADPVIDGAEPADFLQAIINEKRLNLNLRIRAAEVLAPYKHSKMAPAGKKAAQADAAKKVSKFSQAAPPKLVAAGGKKI